MHWIKPFIASKTRIWTVPYSKWKKQRVCPEPRGVSCSVEWSCPCLPWSRKLQMWPQGAPGGSPAVLSASALSWMGLGGGARFCGKLQLLRRVLLNPLSQNHWGAFSLAAIFVFLLSVHVVEDIPNTSRGKGYYRCGKLFKACTEPSGCLSF